MKMKEWEELMVLLLERENEAIFEVLKMKVLA